MNRAQLCCQGTFRQPATGCAAPKNGIIAIAEENMIKTAAKDPAKVMYLEDHVVGAVYAFGSIVVDEKAAIDFASQYDPQIFHTDPQAAGKMSFGRLVASIA
jgi:hypothetical protein